MKRNKKYFFKRCRLCGRCYKDSLDIFSSNEKNLKELIHQYLNINVSEDDVLPKKICQFCDKKISLWETFKKSCENIQVKLIAESLPKKVDKPRSKKLNKCSNSPGVKKRMLTRDNTSNNSIKIKTNYIRKSGVRYSLSSTTSETMRECGERSIAVSGPKMDNESRAGDSIGINSCENGKPSFEAIPLTRIIKLNQNECNASHSFNVSRGFLPKSKNRDNVPQKICKSQDGQTETLEVTDPKISSLNDTLSKNLTPDENVPSMVEEMNTNVIMTAAECVVQNSFLTKKSQENRRKEPENTPVKEYNCSICKKIFHSLRKMKIHYKEHSTQTGVLKRLAKRQTKEKLQCPHCPRKLTTSFNLRHHLEIHSETCNYCCHLCGKLFRTRSSLLNHVRVHRCDEMEDKTKDSALLVNGPSIKLFQCQVCDKTFRQSGHLAYHLKMHAGERLYTCSDCGMSFTENYQLRKHANAVHKNIKRYTCDVCGKQFLHTHNFRDHMLQHDGIANISCDLCGKAFVTSNALARHRRLHTGEKPFSCDICGQKFRDCSNRKRHRDKHVLEVKSLVMTDSKGGDSMSPWNPTGAAGEEARGGDLTVQESNQEGRKEKMAEEETEGKTTYLSLKTYFESNEDVSMKDEIKAGGRMILPLESLITADSGHSPGLLQPVSVVGNIDDSSNPAPLLGCGLFGEEMDLNSESLLLIGDGRVRSEGLLEGADCNKDQLVWVSASGIIQGADVGLGGAQSGDADLRSIRGGDVALSGIQNGDVGLSGIQAGGMGLGGIQGADINGILEVGMELCSDFDVNSGIELDSGKDELPGDFPSIGEIKEVEENEKAFDNVLCLQVF